MRGVGAGCAGDAAAGVGGGAAHVEAADRGAVVAVAQSRPGAVRLGERKIVLENPNTGCASLFVSSHTTMYDFSGRSYNAMTPSIRNPEADALARRLADINDTSITDAVVIALKEAISARIQRETPSETARRILAKHGLAFSPGRKPLPDAAYHDLDHDLSGEA
jgi:antitoxin VapB